MKLKQRLRVFIVSLALAWLAGTPTAAMARDAAAAWDNRCEECHGDAAEFAGKYLWVEDGTLQGRHHVTDLHLFMNKHYIPQHEVDKMTEMLQSRANQMARFDDSCSSCHASAEEFVRRSISTWGDGLTGVETGIPIAEVLKNHQGLDAADAEFFTRLIARVISQI